MSGERYRLGGGGRGWPLMVALLSVAAVPGTDTLVVLSGEAGPYRQVETALVAELTSSGAAWQTRTWLLDDLQQRGLSSIGEGELVVAIGSAAAVWLDGHLPEGRRLFYAMVAPEQAVNLGERCLGLVSAVPATTQVELIRLAMPDCRHLGLLYRRGDAWSERLLAEATAALPEGWRLTAVDSAAVASPAEAIDRLLEADIDLVWTTPDAAVYSKPVVVSLLRDSLRYRVPVFGFSEPFVRSGAMLGTGIMPSAQGRQLAGLLHGADPATEFRVPVVEAAFFLNQTVARKLGHRFPVEALAEADEILGRDR